MARQRRHVDTRIRLVGPCRSPGGVFVVRTEDTPTIHFHCPPYTESHRYEPAPILGLEPLGDAWLLARACLQRPRHLPGAHGAMADYKRCTPRQIDNFFGKRKRRVSLVTRGLPNAAEYNVRQPSRRFAYFPQAIFSDSISLAMSSLLSFCTR